VDDIREEKKGNDVRIIAAEQHQPDEAVRLDVKTNPMCVFGCGHAIYVSYRDAEAKARYRTISDFLRAWVIHGAQTKHIRVPFLKYEHGLGSVAGALFARFGIYPTPNCGCPDRKMWWDWLCSFVPLGWGKNEGEIG
jgi:hypothetical protein